MTETVVIQGATYAFTTGVRDHPAHREAFFALAREVFGLDFAPWHAAGWWDGATYMPRLLLQDGVAVANVSASRMGFALQGAARRYVQLGTVMTLPACRGRGLAGWLMERTVAEFAPACDCLYLLANDEVLDFYRRYGFYAAPQVIFSGPLPVAGAAGAPPVRRLNMANAEDRALLLRCYAMGNPWAALGSADNPGLLMFYCDGPLQMDLYYIEAYGAACVAVHEDGLLRLMDAFGPGGPGLGQLAAALALPGEGRADYGFTPRDTAGLEERPFTEEGTLFIQKGGEDAFAARPLMFPLLSFA